MPKKLLVFSLQLGISLILAFLVQYLLYHEFNIVFSFRLLVISYGSNFLLAFAIVAVILFYIDKLKNYIGFLFMFGSFLKFGVFFSYFYPIFKADGVITRYEFLLFFIPYVVCLLLETLRLTTTLNKS